ncbi:DUF2225 domain-containing protein [Clostridium botulinum]|uniref:DUF2225 domain-containing protein n=1 Tax=Clostridium botulinum TaxID=1491 RepID=A0A846J374_CLOBO|nr:DUF2225 domain-containing protein [Clostridium botulinum]ACA55313.1 conserved hypothetical protein [Clostridium botulinum A3 str. Loch Maree]NFH64554.1 DUF2225 domain-containing protein [Clostridium botulinum]NFJ08288.1 DUF2225 domain-containing protein [Clostridium botulinum]NFK16054.1 DUF2225 domain-containing protein [Clostridium botulinum]NFM94825.1 DUF2225 domain-containing protein [Clostridium botulinum]
MNYNESYENNSKDWPIYKENSAEWLKEKSLLYDREVTCPVCGNIFKAKSIKTSSYRILKKDSDLFIRYSVINPYFYDVWACTECGYAAMKRDFNKIRSFQINSVKEKITPTWIPKAYPAVYNIDIAIERFKLSLLNYVVIESPYSKKGFNSLKLAWMYRLKDDHEKEKLFLNEALESLKEAYSSEDFPIYGMDRYTAMYLIAELMRKTGNTEESLRWFSNVITCPGISSRLKNLARDQKDLIKEGINEIDFTPIDPTPIEIDEIDNTKSQKGFLSRFLNKIKIL